MAESFEIIQGKDMGQVLGLQDQNEADTFASSLFYEHIEPLITFLETSGNQVERDKKFQEKMDDLMSDLADLAGDSSIKEQGLIIDSLLKKINFAKQNQNLKQSTLRALKYCFEEVIDKKSLN